MIVLGILALILGVVAIAGLAGLIYAIDQATAAIVDLRRALDDASDTAEAIEGLLRTPAPDGPR